MQKVTIYGPNLGLADSPDFHVHAEGCADTKKQLYNRPYLGWTVDAVSIEEIVMDVYSDIAAEREEESDWQDFVGEFRFFPCVKLPDIAVSE